MQREMQVTQASSNFRGWLDSSQFCGLGPREFAALGPMLTALLSPEATDSNKALNALNAINTALGIMSPNSSPGQGQGGRLLWDPAT